MGWMAGPLDLDAARAPGKTFRLRAPGHQEQGVGVPRTPVAGASPEGPQGPCLPPAGATRSMPPSRKWVDKIKPLI